MTLLSFILFYVTFLVFSCFVITGFYIVTRGEKTLQPDGKFRTKGKIFRNWSLFWERTVGNEKIYYCGDQLIGKLQLIREYNAVLGNKLKPNAERLSLEIIDPVSASDVTYMKELLHVEVMVKNGTMYIYVEEPIYYWSEWLRYPLSQCPPCMASIGGSLLYWTLVMLAGDTLFAWSAVPVICYIFFWIFFCFALAALNKLAYNIIGA